MKLEDFQEAMKLRDRLDKLEEPIRLVFKNAYNIQFDEGGTVRLTNDERIRGEWCTYYYAIPYDKIEPGVNKEQYCI